GAFPMMWVRGEVTDFKSHRSGHWYFCLRDSAAQVRAVIWSKDAQRIPARPDDGLQVLAYGRLTVFAARRGMQFTVSRLDAAVEGEGAVRDIRRAIVRVAKWGGADALILARGGGSREDLWTFNDERLARTVAASPVPTISAVGHETDLSICDLVADVRAATP